MDFLLIYSQIVVAIYHFMAHLTDFRRLYASNLASQQNQTKINPEKFRIFFGNIQIELTIITHASTMTYSFLQTILT